MTPVMFEFFKPDGTPLADTKFEIRLAKSGFLETPDGIVMPDTVEATTDADGKVTVSLAPSSSLYYLKLLREDDGTEECCSAGIFYKFYVPDQPNPVRVQDLIMDPPPSTTAWDEAAMLIIVNAKAAAVSAAAEAKVSAEAAEEALSQMGDNAERAEAAAAAASQSETNAAASAGVAVAAKNDAVLSKDAAKTSETNAADSAASALASKNAAAASATTAVQSKDAAAGSASAALASANSSADSATAANTSKNAAKASEDAAKGSQTAAAASAVTATQKAAEAAASAQTAAGLVLSPFAPPFTAMGDGVANDTAAFNTFEATYRGRTVDLLGKTVLVDAIPGKNAYVNGRFKVGGFTKPSIEPTTFLADPDNFSFFGGQLADLRTKLADPLTQFLGLVFIGDSITWGVGTGESATSTPRTGTLADPRDFGGTTNIPNSVRDWLIKSYGRSATVAFTNWPTAPSGQAISTVTFPERVQSFLAPQFAITAQGSSITTTEVNSPGGKTGKQVRLASGNLAEISHVASWRFTGTSFTVYLGTNDADYMDYEVFVNGASQGVKSALSTNNPGWATGTLNNPHVWTFPFVADALIELKTRRNGLTGNRQLRVDGIGVTKVMRVTNNGIIGATSTSYQTNALTTGDNMAVKADDRFCFVQTGTNDRIKGANSWSEFDVESRYNAMLAAIPATARKILMVAGPAENETPATYATDMSEIRAMIMRVAKAQVCDFIDNYTVLRSSDMRAWSDDGLHPTGLGYTLIAKNIVNGIEVSTTPTTKANIGGLDQVDNTSDANKPVSTATNTALGLKVNKTDIVDNLTSTDATKVLSAKQGNALYNLLLNNNAIITRYTYNLTTGQTAVTGADTSGKSLVYTPGVPMFVTKDGFDIDLTKDYTAATGTSITLLTAAEQASELTITVFGSFSVGDMYSKNEADAKFYARNNVVGPVSQAGGIPTGAIVEYTNAAVGTGGATCIRFADGTQICTRTGSVSAVAMTSASGPLFTHAGNFIDGTTAYLKPFLSGAPISFSFSVLFSSWYGFAQPTGGLPNTTWPPMKAFALANTTSDITYTMTSIGRWY